jgi:hypothetical protein
MFDRADRDGDGAVNKRELILALRREPELCEMLGLPAHIRQAEDGSRDKFQRLFDSADHEDDRLLSVEEFQELVLSVQQQQQQSPANTSSPAAHPITAGITIPRAGAVAVVDACTLPRSSRPSSCCEL